MDIVILPISLVSIIAICVIIGTLVIAYAKKLLITYALIFANFIVFVISAIFPEVIYDLGFRPIYLSPEFIPQLYTLFTSMFIHGGFLHIIGNMMVFFFVGMAFEQRIGWKKENIYLVRPTNEWTPEFYKSLYQSGLKVDLKLSEAVS